MIENNHDFEVIIIGGGLAGLTAAIDLSQQHVKVLLIEKEPYPRHKVCGEYVSNEVLPYLRHLGFDPYDLGAKSIERFELSTIDGKVLRARLPLGGFGISRYAFDEALANLARQSGAHILHDTVVDIKFDNDLFEIETKTNGLYHSAIALGAYGKRSNLDVKLQRGFIESRSPYLAVKAHMQGAFPDDLVALHNFKGGYCGVSKVENDHLNVCYITAYEEFKKHKNIEAFQQDVVFKNTHLKKIFATSDPVFEEPLTISQISFANKAPIEQHLLMCGDAAGLIHPLCGNGMGMAIRSAYLAAELIRSFVSGKMNRATLEQSYAKAWNKEFGFRLKVGHSIAGLFSKNRWANLLNSGLQYFPQVAPKIITLTHGKPMQLS